MIDFPTLLRGPATVKDDYTAIYLSAKDARRAADYVERLEAENARLLLVFDAAKHVRALDEDEFEVIVANGPYYNLRAALQDTTT